MPELIAEKAVALSPRVARVLTDNPGVMTGPGTNSYLIGTKDIAVLDAGPALSSHVEALINAANERGGRIRWIVLTHTHQDHAPGALELKARTGAEIIGQSPLAGDPAQALIKVDSQLGHGDVLQIDETTSLRALHTPGHVGNHLCYLLQEENLLFSGDHLINGSTVVIIPPSGSMADYLRSLEMLTHENIAQIAPGHGDVIENAQGLIQFTIAHRLSREAKVLSKLTAATQSLEELTRQAYDDVNPALHVVARYSLHAHLIKLRDEGRAQETLEGWSL
ncbi:MAG: MBL fold metallo-hydrolase [Moraxellaceae bacterium]